MYGTVIPDPLHNPLAVMSRPSGPDSDWQPKAGLVDHEPPKRAHPARSSTGGADKPDRMRRYRPYAEPLNPHRCLVDTQRVGIEDASAHNARSPSPWLWAFAVPDRRIAVFLSEPTPPTSD